MTKTRTQKLAEEIIKMAKEDQVVRKGNNLDWDKIKKVDTKNRANMKSIIKEYGYISPLIYGEEAAKSAWLLVQHFPLTSVKTMEHYRNLIKENPKGFDIKSLALFEDRIRVYNKKPQIYGSQAYRPADSKVWYFHKIEDIKNVDKRRKEIGLESLKDYAAGMEADYEEKFVLPDEYSA